MRKLLVPLSVLLIVFVIAGCGRREETTQDRLETWIGASDRELVLDWGAPDSVYKFKDGGRILTWRRKFTEQQEDVTYVTQETRYINGQAVLVPVERIEPGRVRRLECMTNFEIDKQGLVVDYNRKGNGCEDREQD